MQPYLSVHTIDDAMRMVFEEIFEHGHDVHATKGSNREITGVLIEIGNGRARLSHTETRGKPFSCLGELCWYLAGSDQADFISYYVPKHYRDKKAVSGAYGPRLWDWKGISQVRTVTEVLRKKPHSRQAVIQLFDATDLTSAGEDVPCTCTLQFLARSGALHLIAHMRSNDAYLGLPHDFFCFTMLQEIVARSLDLELGTYKHVVGSLHLYEKHYELAKEFLGEGWQSLEGMPPMPYGDPWPSVTALLQAEVQIREGNGDVDEILRGLDPYWADLVRLLVAFKCKKKKDKSGLLATKEQMSSSLYYPFMDKLLIKPGEPNVRRYSTSNRTVSDAPKAPS